MKMGKIKLISCNVNGVRATAKKGFFEWVRSESPDLLCLQEVRCFLKDWPKEAQLEGYHVFTAEALKPGYSGVAVFSKVIPKSHKSTFGFLDGEGRFLELVYDDFSLLNFYLPSGTSGDVRQELKIKYLEHLSSMLYQRQKEALILVGDLNIAHTQNDIKNWKTNQKTSGFLPEERAWLDYLINDLGYIDSFRVHNQQSDEYSWWSQRSNARANNVGWRIDYQLASLPMGPSIHSSYIYRDQIFSDHAPTVHEYRF
jgi:exodeoxyribonuclease III